MKKSARKIVVYTAISADGLIPQAGGDVSWLERDTSTEGYGILEFLKTVDTVIRGSESFDKAIEIETMTPESTLKTYVVSSRAPESLGPGIEWVNEPIKDFAQALRRQAGKDIWLMGGAETISSFLDEGEIDELNFLVMPIFVGAGTGVPLLQTRHKQIRLELLLNRKFRDGVLHLKYSVKNRQFQAAITGCEQARYSKRDMSHDVHPVS